MAAGSELQFRLAQVVLMDSDFSKMPMISGRGAEGISII